MPFHAGMTSPSPGTGSRTRTLAAGSSTAKPASSGPPSVMRVRRGLTASTRRTRTRRNAGGSRRIRIGFAGGSSGFIVGQPRARRPPREDARVSDPPTGPAGVVRREAARVVVLDADGAVLLLRGRDPARPDDGTWWLTPGGGLDEGETIAAAARRELREETGLVVSDLGPVVFERTVCFPFEGVDYEQHEQFFCVRIARYALDDSEWTDVERRSLLGHRWWTLAELVATDDVVHPPELAQLVRDLLGRGI